MAPEKVTRGGPAADGEESSGQAILGRGALCPPPSPGQWTPSCSRVRWHLDEVALGGRACKGQWAEGKPSRVGRGRMLCSATHERGATEAGERQRKRNSKSQSFKKEGKVNAVKVTNLIRGLPWGSSG